MELAHLVRAEGAGERLLSGALARFLALGALLFAVSRALPPSVPAMPPAVVANGEIEALRLRFAAERGRPPEPRELEALVAERVDEEVLLREAVARGLGEADAVVARRLADSVAALHGVDTPSDDPGARAVSLGLATRDPVVRRRLVNLLRLRLAEEARAVVPSEAALEREYVRRREALRSPPRVALAQAYLGPDGDAARRLGVALLASASRRDPRDAAAALPLPDALPLLPEDQLARSFGPGFAEEVLALPIGRWVGPVASVHGLHLVRVERHDEGSVPSFASVRERLREEWLAAREAEALQRALDTLRQRHPVVVERAAPGGAEAS